MMPNGINYVYGPFSARVGDRSAIHMSNMCQFLEHIQDGHFGGQHFAAYGDSAFTPMRPCMISRHVGTQAAPLTNTQIKENEMMRAVREPIEWSYGHVAQNFSSCANVRENRIGYDTSYAKEQLLVCHLMANIKVCLHGNIIGMEDSFDCAPPLLEHYLQL